MTGDFKSPWWTASNLYTIPKPAQGLPGPEWAFISDNPGVMCSLTYCRPCWRSAVSRKANLLSSIIGSCPDSERRVLGRCTAFGCVSPFDQHIKELEWDLLLDRLAIH